MNENLSYDQEKVQTLKSLFIKILQKTLQNDEEKMLLKMLKEVPYSLVVAVEQDLLAEGYSTGQIMSVCDHHLRAIREVITANQSQEHSIIDPLHVFFEENIILQKLIELIDRIWKEYQRDPTEISRQKLLTYFDYLQGIQRHYEKKEQLLFPFLERKGILGPSKVMWAKDDQLRQQFKSIRKYLQEANDSELASSIDILLDGLVDMIDKEEKILFPMCREKFTQSDWETISADLQSFPAAFKINPDELK